METENWIHHLAQEDNAEKSVSFSESHELEEATERFLLELKGLFKRLAREFNHLKKNGHSVYTYKISNVKEGFMLYRGGYRLVFYFKVPGRVRIQMLKTHYGENQKIILNTELQAFRNNPLSCFKWSHKGHKGFAEVQALVSYYFKFFVRSSRSQSDKLAKTSLLSGENKTFL